MGKKTPLYDKHVESGARIVDFGGWDMPLHYGSQKEEHHAVRGKAGVFGNFSATFWPTTWPSCRTAARPCIPAC